MPIRSLAAAVATPRGRRNAAISVLTVAVVGWWWWPTVTNEAAGTDVAIVGDSFLLGAEREVTYRIHEDGFSLVWATTGSTGVVAATETTAGTTTTVSDAAELTWCDAPAAVQDAIERNHPEIVILSFAEEGSCGTDPVVVRDAVRSAAGSAKLIVVTNPAAEDAPVPADSIVVRPSRLIGPIGNTTEGCLWFDSDTCQPDGRVAVRTADGALSPSGQTRIARLIVTALR